MLDVPAKVVTVMSMVPALPAGAAAVIEPSELNVNQLAARVPNFTPVTPVKLLPEMVTIVPPAADPDVGVTDVTLATVAAVVVNWSALEVEEVPALVVTVISTVPVANAGAVAVICVSESTVNAAAAVVPNLTAVAEVKPLPVMLTMVPPAVVPVLVPILVMVGVVAAVYVKALPEPEAEFPMGVVTTMCTVPAGKVGDVATICVLESTVYEAAGVVPNSTLVTPLKFVPVIVRTVPPALLPEVVSRLVIVATEAALKVKRAALTGAEVPPALTTVT